MPPHRLFPPPCPDKNIRHIIHHYIRNAVLGAFADYTLKKERYAQYQYGQPTGATRVSTYAERTGTYIDPVYQ
jgi:hypothetical protein